MNKFISHCYLLFNSIVGNLKKCKYSLLQIPKLETYKIGCNEDKELIVSLTSYGRRVTHTVLYTLLSIFHQTLKPNRVILWLDSDNWNKFNIPPKLQNLCDKGLEIRFCKDIRSYKKLIPTLKLYPEAIIITVDDDVIYSSKLLERLYESYKLYPHAIHCTRASIVKFNSGQPIEYKQWKLATSNKTQNGEQLFPIGIGGILYPPHSLHKDVLEDNRFMSLCPRADDIWFWYMAKLNDYTHRYVDLKPSYYSFDAIYQALHRGSALTHFNVGFNQNDQQLADLLTAYNYRGIN